MKTEPLKNKKMYMRRMIKEKIILVDCWDRQSIFSAIEYLKKELQKHNRKIDIQYHNRKGYGIPLLYFKHTLNKIDEAFEDVVKGYGDGEGHVCGSKTK